MLDVERGMWPCATRIFLPRMPQIDTETMQEKKKKKHGFPDAHGWVFSRILYSCSAAYRLVFDAPSAQRIDADFFASGKLCGRMSHDGLAWYAKNLWKSARSVGDN